jgi:hypothetical protein
MRKLVVLCVLTVAVAFTPRVALAEAFSITSTVRLPFIPGGGSGTLPQYDVTGSMNISDVPTVIDQGDRYRIRYQISFDFLFGNGVNIFGNGFMIVDGQGCGLFNCNMAAFAADSLGNQYLWSVADGAFFHEDGTPYPSVFASALPYAVVPDRFELYGSRITTQPGGPGTGLPYNFSSPIVATRMEGVPEPSTLLLTGVGAFGLLRRTRARRSKP